LNLPWTPLDPKNIDPVGKSAVEERKPPGEEL
jgi:hypothetical protein